MRRRLNTLAALALSLAACAHPVDGRFVLRDPPPTTDATQVILIIFNHGFSGQAGARDRVPPIIARAAGSNPDVFVFSQFRPLVPVDASDMSLYVEQAVEAFHKERGIPIENMILAGQSCGAWGALQAAAFSYPSVGGVLAFAPTCHGFLPHPTVTQDRRAREIGQLAGRLRAPGAIFLYEEDPYYDLSDWRGFDGRPGPTGIGMRLERLTRAHIREVCPSCTSSHGAAWSQQFAAAYYETHVETLISGIRERIQRRSRERPEPGGK